jgi:hypothetical protein
MFGIEPTANPRHWLCGQGRSPRHVDVARRPWRPSSLPGPFVCGAPLYSAASRRSESQRRRRHRTSTFRESSTGWPSSCWAALSTIETTKDRLFEAEANRIAGEIALMSREPNAAKAQDYFEHALAIAHQQRRDRLGSAQITVVKCSLGQ